MKKSIILVFLISFSLVLFAQQKESKLTRKEKKEIRKQEQIALEKTMSERLDSCIDSQQWVLEASMLSNRKGNTVNVNNTLNFIALDGDKAFIQLGSNSRLGPNGVGGISLEARVSKYELTKDEKKGTYFIHIYLMSAVGTFDIQLDSNASGQIASATIQGNTASRLRYTGELVPLNLSSVYRGTPFY